VVEHPHTAHREMVVEMGDGYRGVASPIKLARTPASYRISPVQRVAEVSGEEDGERQYGAEVDGRVYAAVEESARI